MFHEVVDTVQFFWYVYALGAMWRALVAADAMTCLTEFRHTAVITDEECLTCLAVVLGLLTFGYIALIDTFVIVQQDGGNVKPVGAWHTILAVIAWYCGILHHQVGCFVKKCGIAVGQWF